MADPATETCRRKPHETVAEAWQELERDTLPKNAHPIQRQEMRRAFYAGAQSLLNMMMATMDPGKEPTAADLARMTAWTIELRIFGQAIQQGEA